MSQRDSSAISPWRGRSAYRNAWSVSDVRRLRELAERGLSPNQIAKILSRSEFAIRNKAGLQGISLQRTTQVRVLVSDGNG